MVCSTVKGGDDCAKGSKDKFTTECTEADLNTFYYGAGGTASNPTGGLYTVTTNTTVPDNPANYTGRFYAPMTLYPKLPKLPTEFNACTKMVFKATYKNEKGKNLVNIKEGVTRSCGFAKKFDEVVFDLNYDDEAGGTEIRQYVCKASDTPCNGTGQLGTNLLWLLLSAIFVTFSL